MYIANHSVNKISKEQTIDRIFEFKNTNTHFNYYNLDVTYYIREELAKNGPVMAPFFLGSSFDSYTSGVYTDCGNVANKKYYLKIVGWGSETDSQSQKTTKFWIVSGTKGSTWGESGYARIIRAGRCSNFIDGATVSDPKL